MHSVEPIGCCLLSLGANMRRREFLGVIGGAAITPLAARAQQGERMRRVGVLIPYAADDRNHWPA
jgi:putative ABC transport system substrate-binding protein